MTFAQGARVGPYEVLSQLGAGGMGEVSGTERVYLDSLEIAREQAARWYQLRSSRGYASFLIQVGRADEARAVLGICDAITEGRATHDFVYAEALLRTLDPS